ncbi:MAG: DsbA family protein [Candidatus Gracilibacteria bacterium]
MAKKKTTLWAMLPIGLGLFIVGFAAGNLTDTCKADDCKDLQANVAGSTDTPADTPADTTADTPADPIESITESEEGAYYYLGAEDAPVTIIEYTDYQCPFCQRYYFNTFNKIKEQYIATGKVRYTVKDLALSFHPKSRPAAYAARCAGEQDKYWGMHEKIFTYQNQWAYADNTEVVFYQYASELDLDLEEFTACFALGSEKFDKQIDSDIFEASMKGISGTPSFTINDQVIIGAQPFEAFASLIEQ